MHEMILPDTAQDLDKRDWKHGGQVPSLIKKMLKSWILLSN